MINPGESDPDRINRDLRAKASSAHYWDRMAAKAAAGDPMAAARLQRREERLERRVHREMESAMGDFNSRIQKRAETPSPPPPPKIEVETTQFDSAPTLSFSSQESNPVQHQTDTGIAGSPLICYLVLEDESAEIYVGRCTVNAVVSELV